VSPQIGLGIQALLSLVLDGHPRMHLHYQQRNLQLQQLWQAAQSVSPAFVSRPMGSNANPGPNPQHASYKLASEFYAYHQFKMLYFVEVRWAVD